MAVGRTFQVSFTSVVLQPLARSTLLVGFPALWVETAERPPFQPYGIGRAPSWAPVKYLEKTQGNVKQNCESYC